MLTNFRPGQTTHLWGGERIEVLPVTVWNITPQVARVVAYHWDFFGPLSEATAIWVSEDAQPHSMAPVYVHYIDRGKND